MAEPLFMLHDYFFVASANSCVMPNVKGQREHLAFKQEGEPLLQEFFIVSTCIFNTNLYILTADCLFAIVTEGGQLSE